MSGRAFSKNSPLPNIPTEHSYRNINKRARKLRTRMKKGFKIIVDAKKNQIKNNLNVIVFLFQKSIEEAKFEAKKLKH
jgi:hypothetical protein